MSLVFDSSCGTQVELLERSITIGDGTVYHWDDPGIGGLGIPEVRDNDVVLGHSDGSVGQNDFYQPRLITMPLLIGDGGPDKALSIQQYRTLETAWLKSMFDLTLAVTEPGPDHSFYYGRPTSIRRDMTLFQTDLCNLIRCFLTFRCPNPTRYQGS
jgi:hypothetical protein